MPKDEKLPVTPKWEPKKNEQKAPSSGKTGQAGQTVWTDQGSGR